MARCSACSAPLQVNSQHCRYCGLRNDLDLHAHHVIRLADAGGKLQCPECDSDLDSIMVDIGAGLEMAHCPLCFGTFLAAGGLEYALSEAVSHAERLQMQQIDQINRDRFQARSIRYRFCPVCRDPMRRFNFAKKSGVIVDECKNHGFWLDNGELIHLLEWRKSGGHLLDDSTKQRGNIQATEHAIAHARSDHIIAGAVKSPRSNFDMNVDQLLYKGLERIIDLFR